MLWHVRLGEVAISGGEQKTGRVETFGGCDSEREMPSDLERRVLATGMETKRAPVARATGALFVSIPVSDRIVSFVCIGVGDRPAGCNNLTTRTPSLDSAGSQGPYRAQSFTQLASDLLQLLWP